jgi:hypothetical protein
VELLTRWLGFGKHFDSWEPWRQLFAGVPGVILKWLKAHQRDDSDGALAAVYAAALKLHKGKL